MGTSAGEITFAELLELLMAAQYDLAMCQQSTVEKWHEFLYERDERYKDVCNAFRAVQQLATEAGVAG